MAVIRHAPQIRKQSTIRNGTPCRPFPETNKNVRANVLTRAALLHMLCAETLQTHCAGNVLTRAESLQIRCAESLQNHCTEPAQLREFRSNGTRMSSQCRWFRSNCTYLLVELQCNPRGLTIHLEYCGCTGDRVYTYTGLKQCRGDSSGVSSFQRMPPSS